jgi:hypothetical protein
LNIEIPPGTEPTQEWFNEQLLSKKPFGMEQLPNSVLNTVLQVRSPDVKDEEEEKKGDKDKKGVVTAEAKFDPKKLMEKYKSVGNAFEQLQ